MDLHQVEGSFLLELRVEQLLEAVHSLLGDVHGVEEATHVIHDLFVEVFALILVPFKEEECLA